MGSKVVIVAAVYLASLCVADACVAAEDSDEIRQLENEIGRAIVQRNAAAFNRLFASDFTHTSHAGVHRTKAHWMTDLKTSATRYESFPTNDLVVRLYGNTAIVTGVSVPTGQNAKGKPIVGQYRFLRVWVKRDGRWQVVAFQGTRINDGKD